MKIKIKAKRYIVPAQKKIARCGKIDRKKREFGGSLVKFRAVGPEGGRQISKPYVKQRAGYAHRKSTHPTPPDLPTAL